MFAYTTLIFAAAAAAFAVETHPEGIHKRSALASISIKDSEEICAKNQQLVCFDKSKMCGAVDIGGLNESDLLHEHCTATVVCCEFKSKNNIAWGDITNNCIYAGQLS